jgi:hypothetical protein
MPILHKPIRQDELTWPLHILRDAIEKFLTNQKIAFRGETPHVSGQMTDRTAPPLGFSLEFLFIGESAVSA